VIAAPFYVGSESMVPTLEVWDRVLINKLAYDLDEPERGDIVLFRSPEGGEDPLIKRVVGLPGDTIEVRHDRLYVSGKLQREPYVNDEYRELQAPLRPSTGAPGSRLRDGGQSGQLPGLPRLRPPPAGEPDRGGPLPLLAAGPRRLTLAQAHPSSQPAERFPLYAASTGA
jgi:hypothetical protein